MRYLMSVVIETFFFFWVQNFMISFFIFYFLYQHKLGGDRIEAFQAVPVDEKNRLRNIGPAREIEVMF